MSVSLHAGKTNRISVAWVSVATYFVKNESVQWRLPLALSCIGPLGLLAGIYFVPGQHLFRKVARLMLTRQKRVASIPLLERSS